MLRLEETEKSMNSMNSIKIRIAKKSLIAVMSLLLLSTLSGCAELNSSFACKKPPLVMCKSLDQVNTMVNRGQIGRPSQEPDCPTCTRSSHAEAVSFQNIPTANFTTPYPQTALNPGDPLRYGETVMRIWVAAYQDDQGNYYQPSELYTVIKKGYWINHPPKAVDSDED